MVKRLILFEYLAVLLFLVYTYFSQKYSVWMFLLLLFVPDISIAFYKINSKVGGIAYNTIHTYTIPIVLAVTGYLFFKNTTLLPICLIWMMHISMDRFIGYGLKYDNFKETHIQKL